MLLPVACAPAAAGRHSATPNRAQFQAANPLHRAKAAVTAAERKDPDAFHALVGPLDDPDIGVRLYVIEALRRLTGSD